MLARMVPALLNALPLAVKKVLRLGFRETLDFREIQSRGTTDADAPGSNTNDRPPASPGQRPRPPTSRAAPCLSRPPPLLAATDEGGQREADRSGFEAEGSVARVLAADAAVACAVCGCVLCLPAAAGRSGPAPGVLVREPAPFAVLAVAFHPVATGCLLLLSRHGFRPRWPRAR